MTERPVFQISCVELVELVTDYLEGAMTPEARDQFEGHVATCNGCTAYVEQLRETIRLVGRLTFYDLPLDFEEHLLAEYRKRARANGDPS
jgi:anti-sigma factor RsiW